MTNNKKGGYKVGTVISGAQSVDNNVVPVVSSGKNQSVNGQKFGDIMAKSVGSNAGKKNSSTDTLSQNSIRTNTSSSDKNDVARKYHQLIKLRQVILIRRRIQKQIIKWLKKLIKLPTKYMTR